MDHAILRIFWTNYYEVAPGVFRSNQPTHSRFRKYRDQGLVAVLNLRGEENYPHFALAKESCETLGLELHVSKLWARHAPKRSRIVAVLDRLREIPRPFLFHCKSGADRAGFVSAMYLMVFEGKTVQEARAMLSLRFLHIKWTRTGVQDYILDVYEARQSLGVITFGDWISQEYTGRSIQTGFEHKNDPLSVAQLLIAERDKANGERAL
ncbi:MAG: tyrosine-protein phosphatase [Marinovum sp.]|nr:tyrosine-protein phosphatase [Marinovum sp.]